MNAVSEIRPRSPFPKSCTCGATYGAMAWRWLHRIGEMPDGDGGRLELRNCARCSSTISVPVSEGRACR